MVVFIIIGLKLICQLHDLTFNWLLREGRQAGGQAGRQDGVEKKTPKKRLQDGEEKMEWGREQR